jgi:MoaA/NifB/PqqE/SkfB family radical SAM enzyme
MLPLENIRHLHIEFSSQCNARCPQCPRNLFGYPFNMGYVETSLTLELIKKSFSPQFISQVRILLVNGNFGDFTSNLESLEILQYFKSCNENLRIEISTNGSARNAQFWSELGKLRNTEVHFCLDGLQDTHHLYRQDTDFNKILQNAKAYMDGGGTAVWKMIKFDHNAHQIDDCRNISVDYGFKRFELVDHGRNTGPVFNRDGTLSHVMGDWRGDTVIENIIMDKSNQDKEFHIKPHVIGTTHSCITKNEKSIYISAEGKVYPCCFFGFSPQTYDKGWNGKMNRQIKPLLEKNNLHNYDLETCIAWFSKVESAWTKDSYEEGAIMTCDIMCGKVPQA